jgi:hypothetical protein
MTKWGAGAGAGAAWNMGATLIHRTSSIEIKEKKSESYPEEVVYEVRNFHQYCLFST